MSKKRKLQNPETASATKQPRRGRGVRGVLAAMPNMPLDILLEIFQYLVPMDLLSLARTTKVFREFLMRLPAAPLWKTARVNVEGLPDCPSHLSEPAYANLAFYTHCHFCNKSNVKTVFWALGVRYCPACRKEQLVRFKRRTECCSVDGAPITPFSDDYSSPYHFHRKDELPSDVRRRIATLNEEDKEAHNSRVEDIMKWARECELWNREVAYSRENELHNLKTSRLHDILARLRDIGWGDELDRMQPHYDLLRNYPDVNQTRALTDRIWNNIRQNMVEYMEAIRRQRLEDERQEILEDRCRNFETVYRVWHARQTNKSILPRAIDLMRRPGVRALIEEDNEQQISRPHFKSLERNFAIWSAEWIIECDVKLRELVRHSPAFSNQILADVDPLSLARVIFTCKKCKHRPASPDDPKLLPLYPAILAHNCLYEAVRDTTIQDPFERAAVSVSQTRTTYGKHTFWSCDLLEVGDAWATRADKVIAAFGKDPKTVTRQEMDALDDMRVYCFGCPSDSIYHRDVMNWRQALRHYAIHDAERPSVETRADGEITVTYPREPSWAKIIDAHMLLVVRKSEQRFKAILADEHEQFFFGPWYNCSHCSRGGLTPVGLFEHAEWSHKIEEPKEEDFYRSPDAEMALLRPTMLLHPSFEMVMTESHREKVDNGRATWFDFRASAPDPSAEELESIATEGRVVQFSI